MANSNKNAFPFYMIALLLIQHVASDCNVCQTGTNSACVSDNEYQLCANGIPAGTRNTCPVGQKCNHSGNCESEATIELVSCSSCGECNADRVFACTGTKTFALCLGSTGAPSAITGDCGDGYNCNEDLEDICGDVPPSCSYRDDPTTTAPTPASTTPSPATNPDDFCSVVQQEDRFPVGILPDTTCRRYVRCYQRTDGWIGAVYVCPGNTYYSSERKICVTALPPRCRGTTRNLALYNIQLI